MFVLLKTPLNPSTKIPSLLGIASRLFTTQTQQNPNSLNPTKISLPDEPTAASYDELIAIAGRSKDFTTLRRLLNKRYKDGLFNTSKTFKFLTDADLNTDLDAILETFSNLDKGFAGKNAFDCLIIYLCKSKHFDEAICVINTMIEKKVGVNAVTFHPLLNGLTKKRDFDQAWRMLAEMKENGIPIDITSYNYLLTAYCYTAESDLTPAVGVLEKIQEKGLKVDSRTYDALVMGVCKIGKVEVGLKLLRRMEEQKISAQYSTHVEVIKSLLRLGCFAQAQEYVMAYAGRDEVLDVHNFGFLLSNLVRKKRAEEAKWVFGEMETRGLAIGDTLRSEYNRLLLASGAIHD